MKPYGRIYIFTDPVTKLEVTARVRNLNDFNAVEWVLEFTNRGDRDTPMIENVEPLDWTITPPSDKLHPPSRAWQRRQS